jgi:hypothetical protein
MRIPKITMNFDVLKHETEKAYLFIKDSKEVWMPKSICTILNIYNKRVEVNVAPFKFQEMTGIIPQSIDSLVINDIENNLLNNTIEDYSIIEPKGIYLKEKQIDKVIKIKRLKKQLFF